MSYKCTAEGILGSFVLVIKGVVKRNYQFLVLRSQGKVRFRQIRKWIVRVGLGPDIPKQNFQYRMFLQFDVIWFFILQILEVYACIFRHQKVVSMRKAISLQFLSHLDQKLIVDRLKITIMHLPEQLLALVVEDSAADGLDACTVLQRLHKEYLQLVEGEIRGEKGSELILVEADEVNAISEIVSRLYDMKILRRNQILILQSFHPSFQVFFIILLNFTEQLTPINLLLARPFHKQRVSHPKNGMFEHQFLNGYKSAGVVFVKDVDWLTIAFVDIGVKVLQADQTFHAKQV